MKCFAKMMLAGSLTVLTASSVSAQSWRDDFTGYATPEAFDQAYYVYLHTPENGGGSALLDTTAGAVILTAEQLDGGKTFTLTQLLNIQHEHQLGADADLAVEAVFEEAGKVPPWAPEPIQPNRVGFNGQAFDLWGQVGITKKGDPKGKLVAKVAVKDGGGERVVHQLETPGFGTYDGKPVRLHITATTMDLLVGGKSVIGGPQAHGIDWSGPIATQPFKAYVQQQRVFAPQPRSAILRSLAVIEDGQEPAAQATEVMPTPGEPN